MFRCYRYTIIRERIITCLLKLQLIKQSIKITSVYVQYGGGVAAYIRSVMNNSVTVTPKHVGAVIT